MKYKVTFSVTDVYPTVEVDAKDRDEAIRLYHDPIPHWVPAADYLDWARRGLKQDDLHGRDAAVCYAKRAVCRFIDSSAWP